MKKALGVTLATVRYTTRDGKKRVYQYWKARIYKKRKQVHLGMFKSKTEALAAYQAAAREQ